MTEKANEVRYLLSNGPSTALRTGLGSIRQATDDSGVVVAYNEFDPYGNPIVNRQSEIENPYDFTGEWWQDNVSLLHLRARWYAPETGTFLSVDAVESEPPYQYVRGNPINLANPSGYQTGVGEVALGGGAVVVCVATAPACAAAISTGAVVIGVAATAVIIYVTVDYLIQHPELGEVSYPAGPQPTQAPAPPTAPPFIGTPPPPPFVSADGTKPISAIPGRGPAPAPSGNPRPKPTIDIDPSIPPATCTPEPKEVHISLGLSRDGESFDDRSLLAPFTRALNEKWTPVHISIPPTIGNTIDIIGNNEKPGDSHFLVLNMDTVS